MRDSRFDELREALLMVGLAPANARRAVRGARNARPFPRPELHAWSRRWPAVWFTIMPLISYLALSCVTMMTLLLAIEHWVPYLRRHAQFPLKSIRPSQNREGLLHGAGMPLMRRRQSPASHLRMKRTMRFMRRSTGTPSWRAPLNAPVLAYWGSQKIRLSAAFDNATHKDPGFRLVTCANPSRGIATRRRHRDKPER
jgi:hypothetical protein